jgi:hypothetical protein
VGNGAFNIAKGKWAYYCELPDVSDSIQLILFKSAGLQADDVLNNYGDLASIKASNAEADFISYARINITTIGGAGLLMTINNTTNLRNLDLSNQTWAAATSGNTLLKLVMAYKPSSTALDSAIIPLFYWDYSTITSGSDLIIDFNAGGLIDSA